MKHSLKRVGRMTYMVVFFSLLLVFCIYASAALAKTYNLYPEGKCPSGQECIYAFWQISNIAPGDTVIIYGSEGIYKGAFGIEGWKGTAQSPITIKAASGQTPVIEGYVDFQQSEYVTLEGITVTNSPHGAILIQNGSNNITVTKCTVKNSGGGIWIGNGAGMENKITENEVFSNSTQGIAADHINCIPGKETVISRNRVYDNGYMVLKSAPTIISSNTMWFLTTEEIP